MTGALLLCGLAAVFDRSYYLAAAFYVMGLARLLTLAIGWLVR